MTPRQLYAQFMNQCQSGFTSEHHWAAWLRKYSKAIEALPLPLRKAVLAAHANATHKDFSRAATAASTPIAKHTTECDLQWAGFTAYNTERGDRLPGADAPRGCGCVPVFDPAETTQWGGHE